MTAGQAIERLLADAEILRVGGMEYLLAPASPDVLDALAAVGVSAEDMEPDECREDDDPREDGNLAA